jgi:RDD family
MTVARPVRPPTPLEIAKQHVERAFGAKIAKRLDTFEDGTFYVTAGGWARLLSWLVDFVVYLLCASVGFVAIVVANPEVSDNVAGLTVLGLLVGVPVLLGLFYGNGRALGAVLTGTRLVRVKNGGRIGAAAWWAMLVRTVLFPLFLAMLLATIVAGEFGSGPPGSLRRISVDDNATRQLHAAGFLRLDAPGQPPR